MKSVIGMGRERGRLTTAEEMHVLLPRVARRGPLFWRTLCDFEVFARDDDVGGVGCAGPFLAIYRQLHAPLFLLLCSSSIFSFCSSWRTEVEA